jgi:hypothetical protein
MPCAAGVLSHLFLAKSPIDLQGFLQSFLQEQWTRSFL